MVQRIRRRSTEPESGFDSLRGHVNTFMDEHRAGSETIHDWIDHWHDADATDEALPYALNE